MIKPTVEQNVAFENASAMQARRRQSSEKARFIRDVLKFADRVAPLYDRAPEGRVLQPSGETYWQTKSTSHPAKVASEPDSPDMGADVISYRTGFTTIRRRKFVSLGSRVHAADVSVGVYDTTGRLMPQLIGAATILRVVEYPPAVYFCHDQAEMTNIEPGTEAWTEASALAAELYGKTRELTGSAVS